MLNVLRALRARDLGRHVEREAEFYGRAWTTPELAAWQLERFNERWAETSRLSPYFRDLSVSRGLPTRFRSWDEVRECLPITDKATVRSGAAALVPEGRAPYAWRTTGGSTGEPLRIPIRRSEPIVASHDIWYARQWFGVTPADRLFLLWGHSHGLGSGLAGRLNAVRRRVGDGVLGYRRCSAYDLSEGALRRAADECVAFRPAYVLGYAGALDAFARANRERAADFRALELKVAIATAEAFPSAASAGHVSEVLGCPVAMEYGAVETGPLAHQDTTGRYRVFWRHYHIEGVKSDDASSGDEVVVTSLYPRCLPLVRYRIGDLARSHDGNLSREMDVVVGRCNDTITLSTGERIHSELFSHAVKESPSIRRYQVVQGRDGAVVLRYVADGPLPAEEAADLRRRLRKGHPVLAEIALQRVDGLPGTRAGKTMFVVREDSTSKP